MKNSEFIGKIMAIMGRKLHREIAEGLDRRKAFVHVSKAHYETPSTILIEFEGSPARFTMLMTHCQYSIDSRGLYLDGLSTRSPAKRAHICELIEQFAAERSP